jgi:hypothetical protein
MASLIKFAKKPGIDKKKNGNLHAEFRRENKKKGIFVLKLSYQKNF